MEKIIQETEEKRKKILHEPEVSIEKGEENDRYSALRRELKDKQEGGADMHLAQIDVDKLSKRLLDIYEEYKKRKPYFEENLAEFRKTTAAGSDDFNFSAMIMNWNLNRIYDDRHKKDKKI